MQDAPVLEAAARLLTGVLTPLRERGTLHTGLGGPGIGFGDSNRRPLGQFCVDESIYRQRKPVPYAGLSPTLKRGSYDKNNELDTR